MKLEDIKIEEVDWTDVERGKHKGFNSDFVKKFQKNMTLKKYLLMFRQYTKRDDGKYNLSGCAFCVNLTNMDIDIETSCASDIEEVGGVGKRVEEFRSNLSDAKLVCVTDCNSLIFGNDKGECTAVSGYYLSMILNTFGVPDKVMCADDYPMLFSFGDVDAWLAPKIDREITWKGIKFDFKQWCPYLYGIKPNDITKNQLLDMIYSVPLDTTVETLIKNMQSLRMSDGKTQNTEDYF